MGFAKLWSAGQYWQRFMVVTLIISLLSFAVVFALNATRTYFDYGYFVCTDIGLSVTCSGLDYVVSVVEEFFIWIAFVTLPTLIVAVVLGYMVDLVRIRRRGNTDAGKPKIGRRK